MGHRTIQGLLAASLLLCSAGTSNAFNEAGHFYTSYALVHSAPQKELALIALCAQLPDMASDIDAVAVYKSAALGSPLSWWRWARHDAIDSEDTQRLVTIQQLLHALTGGNAEALNRVAQSSIDALMKTLRSSPPAGAPSTATAAKERATALCALGFGFHFYGDSVAHRQLDEPRLMYTTGKGHAGDWSYPDYPMCDAPADWKSTREHCKLYQPGPDSRFDRWVGIWEKAKDLLDIDQVGDDVVQARSKMLVELKKLSANASDRNDWLEGDMRRLLRGTDGVQDYANFIQSQKSDRRCELVLADAFKKLPELRVFQGLTCSDVWKSYAKVVRAEFKKEPDARRRLGEREGNELDAVYMDDPLLKK